MKESLQELVHQGSVAFSLGRMAMAVELLDQAVLLMALESPERLELLPKLGSALARTGQLARADTVLNDAINRAVASGAQRLEWHARIERALWRRWSDPASEGDARATAQDALRVFEKHGDDLGRAKTWRLISDVGHPEGDASTFTESDDALERALDYARRAGDQREEADVLWWVGVAFVFGPLHAETGIRRCQEILSEVKYDGTVRAGTLGVLGVLCAMRGRFAEARDRFAQGITILKELGIKLRVVTRQHLFADIELLANNPVAAERAMRWTHEQEVEMGEKLDIPGTAHRLADALYRQNRYEEATQWIEIAGERGKGMRGLLAARQGDVELAKRLARESVTMTERGQNLNARGTALMRLAEVLSLAGGSSEAAPVLREAIQLYERKGILVLAQAARARLEKPGP